MSCILVCRFLQVIGTLSDVKHLQKHYIDRNNLFCVLLAPEREREHTPTSTYADKSTSAIPFSTPSASHPSAPTVISASSSSSPCSEPPTDPLVIPTHPLVIGTIALERRKHDSCELRRMYLYPQYRGRGLGRKMLLYALSRAVREWRVRQVTAMVHDRLAQAQALYRAVGFRTRAHKLVKERSWLTALRAGKASVSMSVKACNDSLLVLQVPPALLPTSDAATPPAGGQGCAPGT